MISVYLKLVGLIVAFVVVIGFVIPTAVSSRDDFLVIGGFLAVLLIPVFFYWVIRQNFLRKKARRKIERSLRREFN